MTSYQDLREKPWMIDRYFPINLFWNQSNGNEVLGIHWHEHIEILYTLEGNAIFNIGGENIEAGPRDILIVNSGLLHSGFNYDGSLVKYYALVFDTALLASHTPDPVHSKYIMPFMDEKLHFPQQILARHEKHLEMEEILLKVIHEFNEKAPGYQLVVRALLHQLTVWVYRNFCMHETVKRLPEIYDKNIENIKRLILHVETNYPEKMSVEEAARFVSLSPYYFCKTFKRITGRTFIEFLNLYRVNKAEELLRNSQLPVTDIAERVGFCNINYFDRVFKQLKKYPPSACRK